MPTITGLSSSEVAARLAAGEFNRPPKPGTKSLREILLGNLFSVFNIVIGCVVVFLLGFFIGTGDNRLLWDCAGVTTVALFNTVIAASQEVRAKRAMDKVNMLIAREVTVMRDGSVSSIPHDQIVLGDVIVVRRGDQAVVDGPVLESHHLEMDESLLTGESEPVEKKPGESILSGSYCLSGTGYYVVERLSDASFASGITRMAQRQKSEVSPLQKQLNRIVEMLFGFAICLVLLEGALGIARHQLNVDFVRELATVMIGLVPQGLVLTASVIFALGIYRISHVGAVVQSFNAIESFAGVTVICMDKTGTLTQNRMSVRKVTPLAEGVDVATLEGLFGTYARLSSEQNATIRALAAFEGDAEAALVDEKPFSSESKMSSMTMVSGGRECTYVLGAFDQLAAQCEGAANAADAAGLEVYRNLLFGEAASGKDATRIRPLAVVSLSDSVRPDARQVVEQFAARGIALKILSGDSATSILATCRDIGWEINTADVVTGAELDAAEGPRFEETVEKRVVFARLRPEHKVKIVSALRARKIHTAMIGDGVNDVPAIKEADLGIAMDEGAAITKEVADIILRKNRFTLLPAVFEEGERIIHTVGTVAKLFLTKSFLVIYLALASALLLWQFPLTPRRLALFNVFAIGMPALLIAFTNASTARQRRLMPDVFSFSAVSALVIAICGQLGYAYVGPGAADALSMIMLASMTVVSVASFLLVVLRRGQKNRAAYALAAVAILALFIPTITIHPSNWLLRLVHGFYEISPLGWAQWKAVAVVGAGGWLLMLVAQTLRSLAVNRNS